MSSGKKKHSVNWLWLIRTSDPCELNKGRGLNFHVSSRVQQTPEEGRSTYQLKHCEYNNKVEDNSLKTLNNKNQILEIQDKYIQELCWAEIPWVNQIFIYKTCYIGSNNEVHKVHILISLEIAEVM